jgi:proteasome accessory factor C
MSGRRGPRRAEDRVKGLLVMLPWLMKREKVAISEMAKQFNISESDLIEDLELAAMCGMPPYTPLELTEVYIDEGFVYVGVNKHFERRLELTPSEAFGLSLLAAAAEDIPGFSKRRELKSAVKKLRKVLGDGIVDVDNETPQFLDDVTGAATSGERLTITYWTPADNSEKVRTVTVRSVFTDRGHWYITADDDLSGSQRHFRVDRIRQVERTGVHVPVVAQEVQVPNWFADAEGKITVVLEVAPGAAWVVETYPCTVLEERIDGSFRVEMVANSEHWLGRLLLRAEGAVAVVAPATEADLLSRTAADVLSRYENKSGS